MFQHLIPDKHEEAIAEIRAMSADAMDEIEARIEYWNRSAGQSLRFWKQKNLQGETK